MKELTQIWIQDTSQSSGNYPDSLTLYDAGDFLGFLIEAENKKTKIWQGFLVRKRTSTAEGFEMILEEEHEFLVPKQFFAIERYPLRMEGLTLWIPGWKILQKQKQQQQKQKQLHESSTSDSLQSRSRQQPLPSVQPCLQSSQASHSRSLPSPRKLPSVKPKQLPPPSQSKNNSAAKQKA